MKKKLSLILFLLPLILFCLLVRIQFGIGYTQKISNEPSFNPSAFFSHLQNITGTLFIGPDKKVLETYATFFATTDSFLHLENYEITYPTIKTHFQTLSQRGIPIHIILENNVYNAYQNFFKQLQNALSGEQHIQIQSDDPMGTTYVHSKITLNEDAFRIQTANFTKSSLESNREHFFYSTNEEVGKSLVQLFENDWQGSPLKAEQFHPNLVVCPINCRAVIEAMLAGAKESIIIQTQYIFDPAILQILRHKSTDIDLRIIVADTVDNAEMTNYFGPAVARRLESRYNHTKMILVDGTYLLLGSMNLSENSLDNNREIGIMLLDSSLIQQFEDGFWLDWKSAFAFAG